VYYDVEIQIVTVYDLSAKQKHLVFISCHLQIVLSYVVILEQTLFRTIVILDGTLFRTIVILDGTLFRTIVILEGTLFRTIVMLERTVFRTIVMLDQCNKVSISWFTIVFPIMRIR